VLEKIKGFSFSRIILAVLGVLVVILFFQNMPGIIRLTVSIDGFRDYILSLGKLGPVVFLLFQILQTVIAPIPGEVIQIVGGYIYGVTLGTFYTTAGMLIGAVIAFYFTRFLGRAYIEKLLNKKKFQWMADLLDSNKFSVFLFIIFIIPGLPKDMFIYAAGLTPIKPMKFFVILLVSRFPWLLASVSIGANIYEKNYVSTVIISVVAVLAFIFGLIYKDKLMDRLSKLNKISDKS
jgi:uncharacterized membrane protein YdjX (TVP38/TMEM64 family)